MFKGSSFVLQLKITDLKALCYYLYNFYGNKEYHPQSVAFEYWALALLQVNNVKVTCLRIEDRDHYPYKGPYIAVDLIDYIIPIDLIISKKEVNIF